MPSDDEQNRKSTRLRDHDYSGFCTYFLTICTEARERLLGDVVDGQIVLTPYGEIVRHEWWRSAVLREELGLDSFVLMPNHVHAIVSILNRPKHEPVGAHGRAPLPIRSPKSLGSFIAGFKAVTTKRINEARGTQGTHVWQRNYYERIIHDAEELERVRTYIANNPLLWDEDPENPSNASPLAQAAKVK